MTRWIDKLLERRGLDLDELQAISWRSSVYAFILGTVPVSFALAISTATRLAF